MAIFENISREDYVKLPGINASTLKHYYKSIRHGNFKSANWTPPTSAMKTGTMIHKYILEFEDFYSEYALLENEPINPKTKKVYGADSVKYKEFIDTLDSDKEYISSEDIKLLERIRKNIVEHDDALGILEACQRRELGLTWIDEETGIDCKALIDYAGVLGGDLKTIAEIKSKKQLSTKIIDMGYDIQFSFYDAGLKANGFNVPFTIIFAETGNENDIATFEMEEEFLAYGEMRYRKCLDNWSKRKEENTGMFPKMEMIELPGWCR